MCSWMKHIICVFLVLTIATLVLAQTEVPAAIARVIVFYSPTCPHCRTVIENTLYPLETQYGSQLEIRYYDLSQLEDYQVYRAFRNAYPDLPSGVPQVLIGDTILIGSLDIPQQLPALIASCLAEGGCDWTFTTEALETLNADTEQHTVYLAYVYDATCLECDAVTYDLNYLENSYPYLYVQSYDVQYDAAIIEAMGELFDVPDEQRLLAPAIFIGETHLGPTEIDLEALQDLIEMEALREGIAPWEQISETSVRQAEERISERFSQFSFIAVAIAGLLDGLNPCAFTSIIFFVSYLSLVGRKGRDILIIGAVFTLAVFLTYLAMGLGLSVLISQLGDLNFIGKIIYSITALACLVLAIFSFYDWLKIRQGKLNEITLQLPKTLKQSIHGTIRKRAKMGGYIGAAFSAGVLVSVFELACTGQVYLPTIVFMTTVSEMRLSAIFYLALYNLMFVLPLVLVFLMSFWGTTNKQLADFFQNHSGWVKLLTTILFAGLGFWLLGMLFL